VKDAAKNMFQLTLTVAPDSAERICIVGDMSGAAVKMQDLASLAKLPGNDFSSLIFSVDGMDDVRISSLAATIPKR